MPDWVVEEVIIFLVIGAVAVAVIRQAGATLRARGASAHDTDYRTLVERVTAAHEATAGNLADVTGQLAEMNLRVAAMERVLKDVE